MRGLCENLFEEWCDSLLKLQIRGTGDPRLDGAILCPACGRIHGRCGEAMYPFLKMAARRDKEIWLKAARMAFRWSEYNLRQTDGSLLNDLDVDWKGTTVFFAIQLADCLLFHGDLLKEEERRDWAQRLDKTAGFLYGFDALKENNINYPIANALALLLCGRVLKKPEYEKKARELAALAGERFTENGLLFGEGIPHERKSGKGCLPVDLGYNVEESLPSLALYGRISGDKRAESLAEKGFAAHLDFMMEDGGFNNSFGTRCYKWTYWGSRTSDGCLLGLLLYGRKRPDFVQAAKRNVKLLRKCTGEGLLFGGLHYREAGQPPCVHHTFTHAKVLAEILDRGLAGLLEEEAAGPIPVQPEGIRYYPELASWRIRSAKWYAFVTDYDWEYMRSGHGSGGCLSFLWSTGAGVVLCGGMGEYTREEPANMQTFRPPSGAAELPFAVKEGCLNLRIEAWRDGVRFSSMYEDTAVCTVGDKEIFVRGHLKDADHKEPERRIPYALTYRFAQEGIRIQAECREGRLICPVICGMRDEVTFIEDGLMIERAGAGEEKNAGTVEAFVHVSSENPILLPLGTERIFSLVPGFCALRLEFAPDRETGRVKLDLRFGVSKEVQDDCMGRRDFREDYT